ncbi:MAG: SDR family oxidoreductase [Rhodospirillaceae bacterium]|nr:SDR family oxidoreductase [Rhodospirillaceae bacterium]MYH39269.1 SDR family oxidoreductase [Rhodospirillaceae bacterium]MYK12733.1 SDR family oxidoreductase [Rhodospirillaceae bacterium]
MADYLIVGADRGIGLAVCRQLAARGETVVAACLGRGETHDGSTVEVIPEIDVTSGAAVARMAGALAKRGGRIDRLIHVAGVLGLDALGSLDFGDVRRQIEINTIGPLRAVEAALPHLAAGAKVGIVTSRVGSLADNGTGGMYAYRVSKAGANMVALNLHHDLSKRGIAVAALHPGMVATDLTKDIPGDFDYITPDEAAAGLIRRMDALSLESSGRFWHANGEDLPW